MTGDIEEAKQAFREKRPPQFKGKVHMDDHSFASEGSERARRGDAMAQQLLGVASIDPGTPFRAAGRDVVFSEIWTRSGLDRRSRLWITITCACAAPAPMAMETYLRAALSSGEISMAELREFALHFSIFQGFPKGAEIENVLNTIEAEQGTN